MKGSSNFCENAMIWWGRRAGTTSQQRLAQVDVGSGERSVAPHGAHLCGCIRSRHGLRWVHCAGSATAKPFHLGGHGFGRHAQFLIHDAERHTRAILVLHRLARGQNFFVLAACPSLRSAEYKLHREWRKKPTVFVVTFSSFFISAQAGGVRSRPRIRATTAGSQGWARPMLGRLARRCPRVRLESRNAASAIFLPSIFCRPFLPSNHRVHRQKL